MTASISILCTGSELLDGRIVDTNSNHIIGQLKNIGLDVRHVLSCRDGIESIRASLSFLMERSDAVIVSGGLGPTSDDVTRDALAEFVGQPLERSESTLLALQSLYEKRQRKFELSNARQADFPRGAKIIENQIGTAPGFQVSWNSKNIFAVPGVPRELEPMLTDSVMPSLVEQFGSLANACVKIHRVFGLAEAKVAELVEAKEKPSDVEVSYCARFPEICVRISGHATATVEKFSKQALANIGDEFIFSDTEGEPFEVLVTQLLRRQLLTVSTAESCTGGLIGQLLTRAPGASATFLGSMVTYSNRAKQDLLGVSEATLRQHGAVSHETAREMALGARARLKSDVSVSVTGVAGPDGGSEDKPVGTFYIAVASSAGIHSYHCFFNSTRDMIRSYAAYTVLDVLRRYVLGLPPIHTRALAQ